MTEETQDRKAEDPRPSVLEPEVHATPEPVRLEPRVREQALPEKDDDRFFDRWAIDRARELGERVVRRLGLESLQGAVTEFGEWRARRHEANSHRDGVGDAETIASEEQTVAGAFARAERKEARAVVEDDVAEGQQIAAQKAGEERTKLAPPLRGGASDLLLWLLAKLALFGVDLLVLHHALGLTTGTDGEHWFTAAFISAGLVVIGDVLGWIAASATLAKGGGMRIPSWPGALAAGLVGVLAVWFLVDLGEFRSEVLRELARRDGAWIASPTFFTLGQVLFLLGAGVACFSFLARAEGRAWLAKQSEAASLSKKYRASAARLRNEAEEANEEANQAPIKVQKAKARQQSRLDMAEALAVLDRQQAAYLVPLMEVEYMARRAEVEIGWRYWRVEHEERLGSETTEASAPKGRWQLPVALLLGLVAGACAFLASTSALIAISVALVVFVVGYLMLRTGQRSQQRLARHRGQRSGDEIFVADPLAVSLVDSPDRATEIDRLIQVRGEQQRADEEGQENDDEGHGDKGDRS